jgi:hypothetical protein
VRGVAAALLTCGVVAVLDARGSHDLAAERLRGDVFNPLSHHRMRCRKTARMIFPRLPGSVVAENIDTVTALARAGWKRVAG